MCVPLGPHCVSSLYSTANNNEGCVKWRGDGSKEGLKGKEPETSFVTFKQPDWSGLLTVQ